METNHNRTGVVHIRKVKNFNKISILILLLAGVVSCKNSEQKNQQIIPKEYGLLDGQSDSISVELQPANFKTWKDLIKRTEEIACNDSLPKITLKKDKEVKIVYLQNPCWDNFLCILIKQKNTLQIVNDSITKTRSSFSPIDSLESTLRKDLENKGRNPILADSPKKYLIQITYFDNGPAKLPLTLDILTNSYSRVTNEHKELKIWLNPYEKYIIPPPPPPPPTEMQLEILE